MKLSRIFLLMLPAFLLGMIPACKSDSGKKKIAIVTNNPESFWLICEAGAQKAAKEFDVELIFRKPAKEDEQMKIVKDLVEQGVDGIAVSVIDPKEQTPELKIVAGKTKLVCMDNDAEESNRICYIGTDNYAAGRAAGRLVKEVLPKGEVALFVGNMSSRNAQQRSQGVLDELAGMENAKGVKEEHEGRHTVRYGNYYLYLGEPKTDRAIKEEALLNAKTALETVGDREDFCLVGLYAYNPPQILKAMGDRTKSKIVGFDEDDDTLKAVDQGRIHGTIVQDPFNFGYKSVEILAAEARGDKSKSNIKPIPYRVIVKEKRPSQTIDGAEIQFIPALEFRDQLKKLLDSAK